MEGLLALALDGLGWQGIVASVGWLVVLGWLLVDDYRTSRLQKRDRSHRFGSSGSMR